MDKNEYKAMIGDLMRENSLLKEQLSHALQELHDLYHIVQNEPNDKRLGDKTRRYYWENTDEKS